MYVLCASNPAVAAKSNKPLLSKNYLIRPLDASREGLKFYPLTLFLYFFINPPRSAAAQCMAIKCISEVRS